MSGGAYDYLAYACDLEDLVEKRTQLLAMADRLAGLDESDFPGASALAKVTLQLHTQLQIWDTHAAVTTALTRDVWKAVEWWDSADWGPDAVREALARAVYPKVADLPPPPPDRPAPLPDPVVPSP